MSPPTGTTKCREDEVMETLFNFVDSCNVLGIRDKERFTKLVERNLNARTIFKRLCNYPTLIEELHYIHDNNYLNVLAPKITDLLVRVNENKSSIADGDKGN